MNIYPNQHKYQSSYGICEDNAEILIAGVFCEVILTFVNAGVSSPAKTRFENLLSFLYFFNDTLSNPCI